MKNNLEIRKLYKHAKFITGTLKNYEMSSCDDLTIINHIDDSELKFGDDKDFIYWLIGTIRDKSFDDGQKFIRNKFNELLNNENN